MTKNAEDTKNGKAWVQETYDKLVEQGLEEKYLHAGIYCIKINQQIVYIGKSINMLRRVAEHLCEIQYNHPSSNKYVVLHQAWKQQLEIGFDVLYVSPRVREEAILNDIGRKEGILIRKYSPALNYQIPKRDDWHHFTVNKRAQKITLEELCGSAG